VKVLVLGAGLMGAQMGVEYACGGHEVTFSARGLDAARARADDALALAGRIGLDAEGARDRCAFALPEEAGGGYSLIAESVPEDLELKASLLQPLAEASPEATIATNTSSLPITALGEAIGAPQRTVGAHYLNPPLLMPTVEVILGERTDRAVASELVATLTALGKMPLVVERDVPGFVWNRLQAALVREALWLVENGVATPDVVDTVVREGLARRWRQVGPFPAAALGGAATWRQVGKNLLPELSQARDLEGIERWLEGDPEVLGEIRKRRDAALIDELRHDHDLKGDAAAR
jgi:3-hydroxybutyryl-CoA dehydrogenase